MERTKVPNPYHKGEVCQIIAKDNPELRGKGRCWCIIEQVFDFSCTVVAWDGEYTLRIDHLKSLYYSDSECQQMQRICDRMTKIRKHDDLEQAAVNVLKQLGEIKRSYLTTLEEKLLEVLEQH